MKTYYGFDDKYIFLTTPLLLRTSETTIKKNLKNLRLFSTLEEPMNRLRINIFSKYIIF